LRGYGSLLLVPISDVIIIKMEDRLLLHARAAEIGGQGGPWPLLKYF